MIAATTCVPDNVASAKSAYNCLEKLSDKLFVSFDTGKPTFRKQKLESYKAQRKPIEEDLTVQDTIIDESVNVEDEVINAIEREMLRRVLMTLSDEELRIIRDLFNSKTKITEEVLAERLGISQPAVNKRKSSILKKLKKYFDF